MINDPANRMGGLVCVGTFASRAVAETAKCTLEAEGIKSTISAEDTAYDIALAQGGARLLVDINAVDAARACCEVGGAGSASAGSSAAFEFDVSEPVPYKLIVDLRGKRRGEQ